MKTKILLSLFIFVFFMFLIIACVQSPTLAPAIRTSITTQSIPTISALVNKSTPRIPSTVTPTKATSIPSPTETQKQPSIIFPQVRRVCNEEDASVMDLNIQGYVFLIQTYDEIGSVQMQSRSVLIAQPSTMQLDQITGTVPISGTMLLNYKATPDGRWIDALYVSRESNISLEKLISWDGKKTRKLYSGDYETHGYAFLYQENLLITLDESNNGLRPVSIFNYATNTQRTLSAFPANGYWGKVFFITQNDSYNIIFWQGIAGDSRLYLYNDQSQTSVLAFPWISEPARWLAATPYRDVDGQFGIYVFRPYGLDLANGLSLSEIVANTPYDQAMKKIHLPGGDMEGGDDISFQRLTKGLLLAKKTSKDEHRFAIYQLNFSDLSLIDYCISGEADRITISVSYDEKFAAINFFKLDPPGFHLTEQILLNLETRQRVLVPNPNFEIIGWLRR